MYAAVRSPLSTLKRKTLSSHSLVVCLKVGELFIEARKEPICTVHDRELLDMKALESQFRGPIQETGESTTMGLLWSPLCFEECKVGLCPFSPLPVSSCSILTSAIKALRGTCRRVTVHCFLRGSKPALPVARLCVPSESTRSFQLRYQCGQILNNVGLLSVWFNDEDCLACVRDACFLNR